VVSVGHALNHLPDEESVERGLVAVARALRPGGLLAIDLCDLDWAEARRDPPSIARLTDDWAIITEFSLPEPNRFIRQMAVFVRNDDGSWRRDDERHDNVLVDTARVPDLLADHGIEARVDSSFAGERLPPGLRAVTGIDHSPAHR